MCSTYGGQGNYPEPRWCDIQGFENVPHFQAIAHKIARVPQFQNYDEEDEQTRVTKIVRERKVGRTWYMDIEYRTIRKPTETLDGYSFAMELRDIPLKVLMRGYWSDSDFDSGSSSDSEECT